MPFRVAARTILQLGAELISSDAVAFYELIKNAFDARSKRVEIDVVVRIPYTLYREFSSREFHSPTSKDLQRFRSDILDAIDRSAPEVPKLERTLLSAETLSDLETALAGANYIQVRDTGRGMSLDQLQTVYLTIGTRNKLIEAENAPEDAPPILGEKGLGRLSTMRLGTRLKVRTTRAGEKYWNKLDIDWELFSNASDQMIEEVPVTAERGTRKDDPAVSGTRIIISGLLSDWSENQVRDIGRLEFSRLNDPFTPEKKYRVTLRYNGEVMPIPPVNKLLFEHSDATLEADIGPRGTAFELRGSINYSYRNRRLPLYVSEDHLIKLADLTSRRDLKRLGPFSVKLYWFNRGRLRAIEGIGDKPQVRAVLDAWGGGLMLFRDGFRVNPYGGPSDDWLQLDPAAFRSAGYKINRKQIIGKVEITRRDNPYLVDQTNREGLRDNPEKVGLISILQHILGRLREFTNRVDEELRVQEALSLDLLEERVERSEEDLRNTLRDFAVRHPTEKAVAEGLRTLADNLRDAVEETKDLAKTFENRHTQLVNLAALGLMVEIVVHELNRATQNTLATLASAERSDLPRELQGTFETLEAQLRTLQKRLKSLDPTSTAGRQHKETFELTGWIREVVENHKPQFKRHNIDWSVESTPRNANLTIKAVRGMIVEILENLISNSVYWLKWQKLRDPSFKPKIDVRVDTKNRTVSFSDNGPGVEPDRREDIFYAFITTKPSREGKGLGLYISREIAKYNGADLFLSDKSTVRPDRLNTFVLQLGPQ